MKSIIATLDGPLNIETLLPKFIDRLDLAKHPTLKVEDGVDWPLFFASLLQAMKNNYVGPDNEYTAEVGDEQVQGVDANDTLVLLPLVCDGDLSVHSLFLLDELDALVGRHDAVFTPFFEVAYGSDIEFEDAAERFLDRTMCVTRSEALDNAAMELQAGLRFANVEWNRDANSQAASTDGSASAGGDGLDPPNANRGAGDGRFAPDADADADDGRPDADQVKALLVTAVLTVLISVLISMLIKITTDESE